MNLPDQPDSWSRPSPSALKVLSVTELTRQIKGAIEPRFAGVYVRGEISNFKPASSGHLYFTLKDQGACLAAVLFRADAARLKFRLQDGLSVIARGRVAIYEPRGQYQIICDQLEPDGAGALALAFAQLKTKLQNEGLFEPNRKRAIPFLPRRIGLVTSPSGAAIRDFLTVLHQRFPLPVLVEPVQVQGEGAAVPIARAISRLANSGLVDVVVVTRGGGSVEDLWPFNEEVVARAIAASPVPVVSAIGHEVDFTIADFVADKRCATPTDAAKTLAPVREELLRMLDQHRRHLRQMTLKFLAQRAERLRWRAGHLGDPRRRIATERLVLDQITERARRSWTRQLGERRSRLVLLQQRAAQEHPRNRLSRLSRVLAAHQQNLGLIIYRRLASARDRHSGQANRLLNRAPRPVVLAQHGVLASLRERAEKGLARHLHQQRVRLSQAAAGLERLSPLAVLARGYSIAFLEGGRVLYCAKDATPGTRFSLELSDRSRIAAQVIGKDSA